MFENGDIDYAEAEIKIMGAELIEKYHEHLGEADIVYLMREQATKKGGKTIAGTAKKTDTTVKMLTGHDFILTFAADIWHILDDVQHMALVDHELCHCQVSETGTELKWIIRPHDFEDFIEIAKRYGDKAVSMGMLLGILSAPPEEKSGK